MFGTWGVSPNTDRATIHANIRRHLGPLSFPLYPPLVPTTSSPGPASRTSPPEAQELFRTPIDEPDFYKLFQKIRRVTDVTPAHLATLNVEFEHNVPIEDMVELESWNWDDETWKERERECLIENDPAFEAVARIRRDLKLGHMYRFFQALELVEPYYGGKSSTITTTTTTTTTTEMEVDTPTSSSDPVENGNGKRERPMDDGDDMDTDMPDADADPATAGKKKEDKWSMPERFREEMMKYFIEPLCWNHGVRVYPPRGPPRITLQTSRFSVHITDHIHRTPPTAQEARAGVVEGPVAGLQIRHEHIFRAISNPEKLLAKRRKKMLAAAKPSKPSRRSKSKSQTPPPPPPCEEGLGDDDLANDEGLLTSDGRDLIGCVREVAALLHLAQMRAKDGEELQEKIRHIAIGRKEGDGFDDVYIITGMHHHLSITTAKVWGGYLRYLETGRVGKAAKLGRAKDGYGDGWEKLKVRKTRYWSLLDPEERREAARAIIGMLRGRSCKIAQQ